MSLSSAWLLGLFFDLRTHRLGAGSLGGVGGSSFHLCMGLWEWRPQQLLPPSPGPLLNTTHLLGDTGDTTVAREITDRRDLCLIRAQRGLEMS